LAQRALRKLARGGLRPATNTTGALIDGRGGVGPVGACLTVRPHRPIDHCPVSRLSEAAVELTVVAAIHVTVPVEVEVPQIFVVAGVRFEHGAEQITVHLVHVAIAVAISEQPTEAVQSIAPRHTVAVAIHLPPQSVVCPIRPERERVTAIRQRAGDDVGPDEREQGDGLATD